MGIRRIHVVLPTLLLATLTGTARPSIARGDGVGADSSAGHAAHAGMDHSAMHHDMDMGTHEHAMRGVYGPYPMTREASGTAWQPDAARHEGIHVMKGAWMAMFHGFADVVYDDQGGPRGDTKVFSNNMGMAMANGPWGPGTLGLRTMLSAEPATIGKEGYPLLLQT